MVLDSQPQAEMLSAPSNNIYPVTLNTGHVQSMTLWHLIHLSSLFNMGTGSQILLWE